MHERMKAVAALAVTLGAQGENCLEEHMRCFEAWYCVGASIGVRRSCGEQ